MFNIISMYYLYLFTRYIEYWNTIYKIRELYPSLPTRFAYIMYIIYSEDLQNIILYIRIWKHFSHNRYVYLDKYTSIYMYVYGNTIYIYLQDKYWITSTEIGNYLQDSRTWWTVSGRLCDIITKTLFACFISLIQKDI